jgi:hypothetical protein
MDAGGDAYIDLNGQSAAGGASVKMEVANGSNLYALNAAGQWYEWVNGNWSTSADPSAPPPPPSAPDGTILMAGSSGSLNSSAGTWTFGLASGSDYLVLLNGVAPPGAAGSAGAELEVANGGQVYMKTSAGQWFLWGGYGWGASTDPAMVFAYIEPDTYADGHGAGPYTLDKFQAAFPGATANIIADPQLTDASNAYLLTPERFNLRPLPGSPAKTNGSAVGAPADDITGAARTCAVTCGAYQ